jgi:hypothetical protein
MKRAIAFSFVAGTIVSLLVTSCAPTTRLTGGWRDESYQGTLKKILIIGAVENPSVRRMLEDEFVGQLKSHGIDAVPGYSVLPEGKPVDKDTLVAKVNELGADAVLIHKFMEKKTALSMAGGGPSHSSYYSSYSAGYPVQFEYAVLVTNLYDVKTERLIWSATSETNITDGGEQTVRSFTATILDKLTRQKMLPAAP